MDLEEIMEILFQTKQQISSDIIEELATFNCSPEDVKQFLSAIDIYEKTFMSNISNLILEKEFEDKEKIEEDLEINFSKLN